MMLLLPVTDAIVVDAAADVAVDDDAVPDVFAALLPPGTWNECEIVSTSLQSAYRIKRDSESNANRLTFV